MGDSNWKERKASLDDVIAAIEAAHFSILPTLGVELVPSLKARLADSNKAITGLAVDIVGMLAQAVGRPFERNVKALVPGILSSLTDQKTLLRQAVLVSMDKIAQNISLNCMLSSIATTLLSEHPQSRKDLLKWLCEKDIEADHLDYNILVSPILSCLQDKSADIRKMALSIAALLVEKLGMQTLTSLAGDLYKGSALAGLVTMLNGLDTATPNVVAPPTLMPSKSAASLDSPIPKTRKISRVVSSNANLKKEPSLKDAASDNAPPIQTSDLKAKEHRAAADRGAMKWNFETPRRELTDLLADQCQANLSSAVSALLFSVDHYKEKDFLAGLIFLDDYITSESSEEMTKKCIANCDLFLKYLTVRFFDTNTSILLKSLDFLEHLLAILDDAGYSFSEYEASCFIPYFVNKAGDPKETIRVKLRSITKQLGRIYPISKLFGYLLKGLESKNSRTRTECLDELGSCIARQGATAFNPAKTLPLIAIHVSDRDAGVRNACLGALCQAYLILGDDLYSQLGRLSEKDKDMLAERIRRLPASAPAPVIAAPLKEAVKIKAVDPIKKSLTALKLEDVEVVNVPKQFSLDLDKFDVPSKFASFTSPARPRPVATGSMVTASPAKPVSGLRQHGSDGRADERVHKLLDITIAKLENNVAAESAEIYKQLEKLLSSYPLLVAPSAGKLVIALSDRARHQFAKLLDGDALEQKNCKQITNLFVSIFCCPETASAVPADILEICAKDVLLRLVDPEVQKSDTAGLSKLLNILMVRIIENANPNSTFRCLLHILQESALSDVDHLAKPIQSKYNELVMKCIWKMTKILPALIESRKLVVEDILFDIHDFLIAAPPQYWKKKALDTNMDSADMPLRTIKTVLHEIVNNLGADVMHYAAVLPNQHQSHVVNYLRQMVLSYEKKRAIAASVTVSPSNHGQEVLTKQLDTIFTLISDKEHTKQGIQQLFDFQKKNPGAFLAVETRLSQTGSYFQGYIRRGLAALAQSEMDAAQPRVADVQRAFVDNESATPMDGDADSYKETLVKLQRMFIGKDYKVCD